MKFGKVDNPEDIDFTIPIDHPDNSLILPGKPNKNVSYSIGCAKWNKQDLKGFYPKGIKDELEYYATQFNSIELNATFYRIFPPEQFTKWAEKTPENFKFYPKLPQTISQFKKLIGVDDLVREYCEGVRNLGDKLGMVFLQMGQYYKPKEFSNVVNFIESWPKDIPLAFELRHADWYSDGNVANELYQLLEANNITHVLVDTAGRRDLMHMRHTTTKTFIRYVGSNHESDASRLTDWVDRIEEWVNAGMAEINFFVHQNLEKESPLLSAAFINEINEQMGTKLHIPKMAD